MRRLIRHGSSLVLAAGLASFSLSTDVRGQQNAAADDTTEFTVLARGQAVGSQRITVTRTAEAWTMSASGNLGLPFDLSTTRFQLRYSPDWRPVSMSIEAVQGTQLTTLNATFADGRAHVEGMQRGQQVNVTQAISAQPVITPTGFYPAYEALAARLGAARIGDTFQLYFPASGEVAATLTRTVPHRLTAPGGAIDLREFDLTLNNPGAPIDIEVWTDQKGRLARLAIPASWFVMIRNDISSVTTREETIRHPGEEELFIPALAGFQLAATLSKPTGAPPRAPAVVLVGASGREDRDERMAGVPIFADLAYALSQAGFAVVRYDKRGIGRSGGRTESSTLADYAEDAVSVVQWLRKRRDVDPDRIAVAGYGDGGAMALLAGEREKRIKAIVLLASPGQTGREITLVQQQKALAQTSESDAVKQERIALQQRILDAVVRGTGWEGIAPELRQRADTPWFKSWLLFAPAKTIPKVKQPLLIVTGSIDSEFPVDQADWLESLGHSRKKVPASATQKIIVPGVNHFLGAPSLGGGSGVSPAVLTGVVDWLKATLPPKR
jgi:pimeloyl-ACP methyl ester carboxylesterase